MATNTTNFSLPKPDANENFNRIAYNALIDAIDSKVGAKTNAADTHIADLIKHITAGERDKWNASQLFALTSSTGSGKTPTNNDLNATITAGFYNVQASNLNSNSSSGTMFVSTQGSSGISQIFHTTANKLFTRFSEDTGATWSTWVEQETAIGAQAKVDTHAADAVKHITGPERDKWNGGQLFKLTANDGTVKQSGVKNLDEIITPGEYFTESNCIGAPDFEFYHVTVKMVDTSATVQIATRLFGTTQFYRVRVIGAWRPWKKLVDSITVGNTVLGNKFVDQSKTDFLGKEAGSTTNNPHIAKAGYANNLPVPAGFSYELLDVDYLALKSMGDGLQTTGTPLTAGTYALSLFSYNLIEHVQRTYGEIPGANPQEKVSWVKSNLSKITFNWWGFGSSPSGNRATVVGFSAQWDGSPATHTTATTTKLSSIIPAGSIPYYVQPDGFVHFLAYAEPASNSTPSIISTDYVELVVEVATDIKSNIPNATPSTAGLQSGADKAKLDGISTGANKTTSSGTNGNILVDNAQVQVYAHPTGDGNSHVPATGTTNGGKVLKAGGTANALSWAFVDWSEIINKPSTFLPSAHNHAIADVTGLSTALSNKLDTSQRGAVNGVASLGSDGKVPTSQLPTIANAAADITIADAGNYFDGANVETGMQEIGRVLAGARTSLVASAQQLGVI